MQLNDEVLKETTYEQYMDSMSGNRKKTQDVDEEERISSENKAFFANAQEKNCRAMCSGRTDTGCRKVCTKSKMHS